MGNTTSIQDKFTKNCVNVIISSDSFKVQVKFGKKKKIKKKWEKQIMSEVGLKIVIIIWDLGVSRDNGRIFIIGWKLFRLCVSNWTHREKLWNKFFLSCFSFGWGIITQHQNFQNFTLTHFTLWNEIHYTHSAFHVSTEPELYLIYLSIGKRKIEHDLFDSFPFVVTMKLYIIIIIILLLLIIIIIKMFPWHKSRKNDNK